MTDKEKIREEVVRMHNLLPVVDGDNIYLNYADRICTTLEMYIDSLQKEPVSIWHDASKKSDNPEDVVIINPSDNTGEVLTKCTGVNQGHIWAYTSELLKLDNLCNIGKNLQEESVSEELEEAVDGYTRKVLERTNCLIGNQPVGEEISKAVKFGAKWQKAKDESTTEDLEDYINELSKQFPEVSFAKLSRIAVRVAKWQQEHLWKSADGDDLPEYDREVVVFTQNFPDDAGIMSVAIAHRPNPDGLDGKSLSTGKVEHYTPKTYDKGG